MLGRRVDEHPLLRAGGAMASTDEPLKAAIDVHVPEGAVVGSGLQRCELTVHAAAEPVDEAIVAASPLSTCPAPVSGSWVGLSIAVVALARMSSNDDPSRTCMAAATPDRPRNHDEGLHLNAGLLACVSRMWSSNDGTCSSRRGASARAIRAPHRARRVRFPRRRRAQPPSTTHARRAVRARWNRRRLTRPRPALSGRDRSTNRWRLTHFGSNMRLASMSELTLKCQEVLSMFARCVR